MIRDKIKYSTNKELVMVAGEAQEDRASVRTLNCTESHPRKNQPATPYHTSTFFSTKMLTVRTYPVCRI